MMCISQGCEQEFIVRCSADPGKRGVHRVEGSQVLALRSAQEPLNQVKRGQNCLHTGCEDNTFTRNQDFPVYQGFSDP